MDLKMGSNKDLLFINGECPVTKGHDENVAQRLLIRLRTFLGEWFLNSQYGVPWERVIGQKIQKSAVDLIVQEQIYKEKGVVQITSFSSTLDKNRIYSCRFRVRATNGQETEEIVVEQ